LASAFYIEPSDSRRTALTSYYRSLESVPLSGPVASAGIDAATYGILLDHIEQLRPTSFLRPPPTNWSDFESAVVARFLVEKRMEDGADGCKKDEPMEISLALHSALDDIQQILSAGPSSSHDHTHLDEQALGEITAFLQSGPPVIWPETDAVRLTNVGSVVPATSAGVTQQNFAIMSTASPSVSVVSSSIDQKLLKPAEKLTWNSQSASVSTDDSAGAVVSLKRYQCVLCMTAFDVPPSTEHHNGSCSVCPGDVLEVPVYRCRRCSATYYSDSAANHHALFLCTRDDAGDEIGHLLRHYRCPICHVAFFSSAGLQSHTACLHGTPPHSASSEISGGILPKVDSLTDSKLCQSEVCPQQSGIVQSPVQVHSPLYVSGAASNSPASAEDASLPYKVDKLSDVKPLDATTVGAAVPQTKPRASRRYSGRPPKGIIYKNVFMTSEGLYYCSTCNADLNTVERRAEHRDRPCGRASAASYARHYVFICPHCSSRWSSQKACYEHQITSCLPQLGVNVADLSLRRYACPICSRLHFSLAPLRGHMTTAHRLHRDEVIQRLIAAGYMTPEGSNVKLDNVIGVQETSLVKPSKSICSNPSSNPPSTITEAEVIALLNKELRAALNEREYGPHNQSSTDRKSIADVVESAKTSDSSPSKFSVLTAFPQLPKPVLNLRAIPKIMATTASCSVVSSSTANPCSSSPHTTSVSLTAAADTKFHVNDKFCNGDLEHKSAVVKNIVVSNGDLCCVSSSTASVYSTVSASVKDDVSILSSQELKQETSENGAVLSHTAEVTSTEVSPKSDNTCSIAAEMEKHSNGCSGEVPVRNGKLKFIIKSDVDSTSGQQIKMPVVALERTTLAAVSPTVSLSVSSRSSKLRPRQHASVHFSSANAVGTRHHFSRQRIMNLRKSTRVSSNWKSSVPVLRINRPRQRASHGFSCKCSLSCGNRLADQRLRKKKSLESQDFAYDQHSVTHSRHSRRQFTTISSGADTDAISTRSQCRQILKHSVVR